jgi:hypothetical protein
VTAYEDGCDESMRTNNSSTSEYLRLESKAISLTQGAFPLLRFSAHQIPNFLTEGNLLSDKQAQVSVSSRPIALRAKTANSQTTFGGLENEQHQESPH